MLLPLLALALTAVSSLEYSRNDFPLDFVFGSVTLFLKCFLNALDGNIIFSPSC